MTNAEAITWIKSIKEKYILGGDEEFDDKRKTALDMAIQALERLDTSDKVGHWVIFPPFMEEICMCSNCKTRFKEAYQHRDRCPNCGARMESEE